MLVKDQSKATSTCDKNVETQTAAKHISNAHGPWLSWHMFASDASAARCTRSSIATHFPFDPCAMTLPFAAPLVVIATYFPFDPSAMSFPFAA
ncbi:hypothetical protein BC940DRAFT_329211 [Gongronella butleri]|nr:hypothetical protein BC940DRAFT_335478 [Gongronella butleri]KAI8072615.1 hypothetical protein BC940DRAFT_330090 [Gongronella butleri]KAI8074672.1 hypothetical protein BC940DRAFT_329211 [Gongronella butleri]